ncbi:membrane protein YqaA with SNARE-associated domain [Natronocella acetinitrilica]|uniref:Membrane protein YqaA with SNARE-associated domain n=1 Tax=Natronocella acetinitrilica TaxID=414046 RepID=A0AAE3KHB4_9GAMM|nr:YqaA family protein [Natronocella acetinitrilica]MCP1676177.1 membrane protein YqaA with SNARE-associated domain [Natronocella acetinitrilica]
MIRVFSRMYEQTLRWAAHRYAPRYLAVLSFAESSFFPIPPDVMLAPMALARPNRALHFAALTTVFSVLGGLFGYLIGYFAIELVMPLIVQFGQLGAYEQAQDWFMEYGFWVVLIAGFSPIPYKVFTIAAGALILPVIPFVLASLVGRGGRFFLVALLVGWGGPRVEPLLKRYIDWLGWGTVILLIAAYFYLR